MNSDLVQFFLMSAILLAFFVGYSFAELKRTDVNEPDFEEITDQWL